MSGEDRLRMAVLGGGYGSVHLKELVAHPNLFEVKAFCDRDPAVVDRIRTELPEIASTCADFRDVLEEPGIDAVVVSLPHHLHESACLKAARRGKHILVDKPIARTLAEADRMIQSARENRVTLMVAHNFRFIPAYRQMHDLVVAGRIGRPLYAMTRHIQNFHPATGSAWRSREAVGGGCVMGSGVHNLDLMRWFFGEPMEVFAHAIGDPARLEAEAAASISFRYQDGPVVTFGCNWCSHGAMNRYEWGEWDISGTEGDLAIRQDKILLGHEFGAGLEEIGPQVEKQETLYEHFARCVAESTEPLTSGPEARASLALVLKVYESIKAGRPVAC